MCIRDRGEAVDLVAGQAGGGGHQLLILGILGQRVGPVSYTHLDVYKRQGLKGDPYSKKITDALEAEGYSTHSKLIDMSEYGVPQRRKRFILVASKSFSPSKFFELLEKNKTSFLTSKNLTSPVTCLLYTSRCV